MVAAEDLRSEASGMDQHSIRAPFAERCCCEMSVPTLPVASNNPSRTLHSMFRFADEPLKGSATGMSRTSSKMETPGLLRPHLFPESPDAPPGKELRVCGSEAFDNSQSALSVG